MGYTIGEGRFFTSPLPLHMERARVRPGPWVRLSPIQNVEKSRDEAEALFFHFNFYTLPK
jgi:hypothetical protein